MQVSKQLSQWRKSRLSEQAESRAGGRPERQARVYVHATPENGGPRMTACSLLAESLT